MAPIFPLGDTIHPAFGFGIFPLGPKDLPKVPATKGIILA